MTSRRQVLRGISAAGVLSVAGCVGSSDGESSSSDEPEDEAETQQSQGDEPQQQGKQSPSARQGDEIPPVEVVIDYWSDWSGNISTPSTSTSVQGDGKDAWKLSPMPTSVSVVAQKEDDSLDPLTVEIYVDGVLASEQSTTAEYGVVRLSVTP